MADLNNDLLDRIKEKVDGLELGVESKIGVLAEKESISIFMLPSSNVTFYMDGSMEKTYNIQVDAKFKKQRLSYNKLITIQNSILKGTGLGSKNGSYSYIDSTVTNSPHLTSFDEDGYYIYSVTFGVSVEESGGMPDEQRI